MIPAHLLGATRELGRASLVITMGCGDAVARVARVVPPGGPYTPGIGIAFMKMGRDIEELILHYVEGELARA